MICNAEKACCFIGHRTIEGETALWQRIRCAVERLIRQDVEEFIFGDRSEFNDLCNEVVTELQQEYPKIRRIQFRVAHPVPETYPMRFTQGGYDESAFPGGIHRAGRAAYMERNEAMIRASQYCIFYYNPLYTPKPYRRPRHTAGKAPSPSGTRLAYQYAQEQKKVCINLYTPPGRG